MISDHWPDTWAGFPAERRALARFLLVRNATNVLLLARDAHMLALEDGHSNRYATAAAAQFPVVQAGPIDFPQSLTGGP